ncbi:hypothetical protein H0W91_03490 [Patescibacteria group bacterium]|nr:hypothetical protein [Patescibacteria group bacterium]
MFTPNSKNTLIGVAVVILIGLLGYFLFKDNGSVKVASDSAKNEVVGQDIITLVEKLKAVAIDQTIFTSALFSNLKDHEVSLYPESQGRPNPFLNFGNDSGVINSKISTGTKATR